MLISEFEILLKTARTPDQLDMILQNQLAKMGIYTFSFTYYSRHTNSLNKLKHDFASANFRIWHQHYLDQHYEEVDSTLEKVHQSNLPTFWDLQQQLKEAKTLRERQMRLDSIAFGAVKGLSIPIHGPQEDFASFLVVQMQGENCLEHWQKLQYELFLIGYYYYSYLQPLLLKTKKPEQNNQLNKRHAQCLHLIAQQYSVKDIAKKLNITERTVNYHIQRLNKKMGTKNKHQSVIKALQKGLIT